MKLPWKHTEYILTTCEQVNEDKFTGKNCCRATLSYSNNWGVVFKLLSSLLEFLPLEIPLIAETYCVAFYYLSEHFLAAKAVAVVKCMQRRLSLRRDAREPS